MKEKDVLCYYRADHVFKANKLWKETFILRSAGLLNPIYPQLHSTRISRAFLPAQWLEPLLQVQLSKEEHMREANGEFLEAEKAVKNWEENAANHKSQKPRSQKLL